MNNKIATIEDFAVMVQMEFAEIGKRFDGLERRMDKLELRAESFATKEDLKNFATKDDLKHFVTKQDLKHFATKEDLKGFATKEDLKHFATKQDLKDAVGMLKREIQKLDVRTPVIDLEFRVSKLEAGS
jgi:hypothetical protein